MSALPTKFITPEGKDLNQVFSPLNDLLTVYDNTGAQLTPVYDDGSTTTYRLTNAAPSWCISINGLIKPSNNLKIIAVGGGGGGAGGDNGVSIGGGGGGAVIVWTNGEYISNSALMAYIGAGGAGGAGGIGGNNGNATTIINPASNTTFMQAGGGLRGTTEKGGKGGSADVIPNTFSTSTTTVDAIEAGSGDLNGSPSSGGFYYIPGLGDVFLSGGGGGSYAPDAQNVNGGTGGNGLGGFSKSYSSNPNVGGPGIAYGGGGGAGGSDTSSGGTPGIGQTGGTGAPGVVYVSYNI